ncbi:putative RNA polymerase II subunit B1 CTD phosphatase RPAP2-like protein [Leptotrombidium deliense]|uniref:RNA polymerase II subunit B1 CTD phosphatase RPAP2 homolog n=1 Tax=Leptotrombidium deliense TaxID=299467 RepID=A0A443S9I3_9ACAR|nr:putative RNA polymerase II subunit B1 CTD phosphatase RPAP2-like protein [Leptotrombidium deliense]
MSEKRSEQKKSAAKEHVKMNERQKSLKKVAENRKLVLRTVEKMIDCAVDEKLLIESCKVLSKADFEDLNVERSLTLLCGYPLCSNALTNIASQKYKISLKEHKVFDLTERKLFCSDICFTASKFVKKQLRDEAFWLSDDKSAVIVEIYRQNFGDIGNEVRLSDKLTEEEECKTSVKRTQNRKVSGLYFPYLKENQMEKLKESMSSLTIREKPL